MEQKSQQLDVGVSSCVVTERRLAVITAAVYGVLRPSTAVERHRQRSTAIERVRTRGRFQKSNIARFQYRVITDAVNRHRRRASPPRSHTFDCGRPWTAVTRRRRPWRKHYLNVAVDTNCMTALYRLLLDAHGQRRCRL